MGRGALALHATFLESELTSKPAFLSWEEASALNGRVQTGTSMAQFMHCFSELNGDLGSIPSAYHAIVEAGKLRAGQRLFINGTPVLQRLSKDHDLSGDSRLYVSKGALRRSAWQAFKSPKLWVYTLSRLALERTSSSQSRWEQMRYWVLVFLLR